MVISKYIITLLFVPLLYLIETYTGDLGGPSFVSEEPPFTVFIIAVIIAPILETLIFQKGIIILSRKIEYIKNRVWLQIVISALIFGLNHTYSVAYIFVGFLLGLIFAYSYIVSEDKKSNALRNVIIIHSLSNMISILITLIENSL
jgi:membrane protease YdiL (CAAX protease family)